jgi:hypothetical protein
LDDFSQFGRSLKQDFLILAASSNNDTKSASSKSIEGKGKKSGDGYFKLATRNPQRTLI